MMNQITCPQLGETLYHTTHPSGLEIYVLPKPDYSKSYAIFATKYGSADADFLNPRTGKRLEVPDGVAHFLEHKMFEQPDGTDAFATFSETGAEANAFTSFLTTAYLFSCTSGFEANLRHLLDFVQTPYFTEENVAKEQGIIGQEIRMYEDDPQWRSYFNTIEALYHNNPVRRDIAGTVESIAKITPQLLYDCYRTFYHPSNMILFCTGQVNPEQVEAIAAEAVPRQEATPIVRYRPEEPEGVFQKEITQKMSVAQPLFYLGMKMKPEEHLLRQELTCAVLLEAVLGKSSALYQELYAKGLITPAFGTEVSCEREFAHLILGGSAPDPFRSADAIRSGLEKIRQQGLAEEDFNRAKKIVLGDCIRLYNHVDQIAHHFVSSLFRGSSPFDAPLLLNELSVADCNDMMHRVFCPDTTVLSVISGS